MERYVRILPKSILESYFIVNSVERIYAILQFVQEEHQKQLNAIFLYHTFRHIEFEWHSGFFPNIFNGILPRKTLHASRHAEKRSHNGNQHHHHHHRHAGIYAN